MAFKRLSMRKIHRVLRLFFEAGLSVRAIARSIQASPSTVGEYILDKGIRDADQIIVPEEGRVVEVGAHDVLLKRGGLYAHLVSRQLAAGTVSAA